MNISIRRTARAASLLFLLSLVTTRYSWDAAAGKFVRPEKAYDRIPLPNMEE